VVSFIGKEFERSFAVASHLTRFRMVGGNRSPPSERDDG